jgi:hypothetical protein
VRRWAFGGNFVVRTTDVFTPNKLPVFSYVERGEYNFETRLGDAPSIPNMIISLSGPSKSGKTVLVTKVIGQDLIQVSGATIRSGDELWGKVLDWMDAPEEVIKKEGSANSIEGSASAGGGFSILPLFAQAKGEAGIKTGHQGTTSTERTFRRRGFAQVIREIAGSDYAVFVDDFHYIPKEAQKDIGRKSKKRPKPAFGL